MRQVGHCWKQSSRSVPSCSCLWHLLWLCMCVYVCTVPQCMYIVNTWVSSCIKAVMRNYIASKHLFIAVKFFSPQIWWKKINIRRKTLLEWQLKKFLSFKHNAFCYSLISFLLNTCLLFGSGPMKPFYRCLDSVAGGNELLFSKLCADYFSERGSQAGKWGEGSSHRRWKQSLLFCLWLGCRERVSLMRNKNFRFIYTPSKCLRQVAPANKLAMLLSSQVYCCKRKGGRSGWGQKGREKVVFECLYDFNSLPYQ